MFRPGTPGYIDVGTGGRDVSPTSHRLHNIIAVPCTRGTTNQ
jgi:hypothetical protein